MDPESCYWFVIALMETPWAPLKMYYSATSPPPARLPIFSARLGCELALITMDEGAGATFALTELRSVMNAMISQCIIQRRMVGTAKIKGDRGSVGMTITGVALNEQGGRNPMAALHGGLNVTSNATVETA